MRIVSSIMDDTRPTFGQALESAAGAGSGTSEPPPPSYSEAASASSSDAPSADPASPATAATQPGAGDGSVSTSPQEDISWTEQQGPVPFDRHKSILESTRSRAQREAESQLQQQYGWALQVGPENFQAITNLARQWASDPIAFVLGALDELQASPEYAPQLRSHVAKILAQRPQQAQPAAEDEEPQPDITVDGYSWYSAKQLALRDRWLSNKLLGQVRSELAPLRDDITSRQQRDEVAAAYQKANAFARDTLTEMTRLPYFTEQKAEIERVFAQMPPMPDSQVGQAIRDAYIQVLVTKVLPALSSTAKSELLSTLNTKAAASARNPQTAAPAVNGRPTSFEEALRQQSALIQQRARP
jgi:hypothetical protein